MDVADMSHDLNLLKSKLSVIRAQNPEELGEVFGRDKLKKHTLQRTGLIGGKQHHSIRNLLKKAWSKLRLDRAFKLLGDIAKTFLKTVTKMLKKGLASISKGLMGNYFKHFMSGFGECVDSFRYQVAQKCSGTEGANYIGGKGFITYLTNESNYHACVNGGGDGKDWCHNAIPCCAVAY